MAQIKLNIQGLIKITSNTMGVVYRKHNTITPDALEIITNCLYQRDFTKQIDTIAVMGDFGVRERTITSGRYNPTDNTITFKAVFYEGDFEGTIEEMTLIADTYYRKKFAEKEEINIHKDGESRVQIEWTIQITN